MRRIGILGTVGVVLGMTVSLVMFQPAAALGGDHFAGVASCQVKNLRTGATASDLRAAITAARAGDTLKVKGVCGSFTVDKNLTLVGPATLGTPPCPECGGIAGVVSAGRLTLRNLTVWNGSSTYYGGGMQNYGTLILSGTTSVTGNWAEDGAGGIYNEGLLVMRDSSSVTGNSLIGRGRGGGIWNAGTLVMRDSSSVTGNSGGNGGGIYNTGTVVMMGRSLVKGNRGTNGGGVDNVGTLVMKDSSSITGNSAEDGGGILNTATVRFIRPWNGTVCGNTPDDWGRCTCI